MIVLDRVIVVVRVLGIVIVDITDGAVIIIVIALDIAIALVLVRVIVIVCDLVIPQTKRSCGRVLTYSLIELPLEFKIPRRQAQPRYLSPKT